MYNRKLFISPGLDNITTKGPMVGDFINFCSDFLPIKGDFQVYIIDDRDHWGISTTASYIRDRGIVLIYGKNRAIVDVLRSVAHELVHLMQDETDMLDGEIQDAGGPIEDEANAKAGEIIKLFAKSHPERRKIYEAIRYSCYDL